MSGAPIEEDEEITGINVTPLVDITLVLLIIFMVTTSLISSTEGLHVDKPDASSSGKIEGKPILIECGADGTVMIDKELVEGDAAITDRITTVLARERDVQGVVLCDEAAQVGQMVHLIDLLRNAGVKKYAIATEAPAAKVGG